jgi:AcrR family transcriptional regulator
VARPKNQTARRRQIAAATRRVVLERGAHDLRLKDIADAAGLSTGSISYYYPDVDELLLEVYQHSIDRFYSLRVELTEAIPDVRERLLAMISSGLPKDRDDQDVGLLYELGTASRGSKSWGVLISTLYERQVALYQIILEVGQAQGIFKLVGPTRSIARNLVALEDAYGLHIVTNNVAIDYETARRLICDFAELATSCEMRP